MKQHFSAYLGFIVDLDGVIWVEGRPIEGAVGAIKRLRKLGRKLLFLTNNSTRSRRTYVEGLRSIGLRVGTEEMVNSGYATSIFLRKRFGSGRAYVVGEEGLIEELKGQEIEIVDRDTCWEQGADFVVVGMDRQLDYRKIACAMRAIRRGAVFVATNADKTFPSEMGMVPGAGSMVASIEASAGKEPDHLIGKPSRFIFEVALESLSLCKAKVLVLGDRIDTDIAGARAAGLDSALVLTGVSRLEDLKTSKLRPEYTLESLTDLFE